MKIFRKYLWILALTAALLLVAVYPSPEEPTPLPRFVIPGLEDSQEQYISIFDDEKGNYYVFLPAYADLTKVTIQQASNQLYTLDETVLSNGMNCGDFQLETPYAFSVNQEYVATFRFYQSANVATMYVDTISGNMEYLHCDKTHRENAALSLYTADGALDYRDSLISLNGRGNSTWEYDKRPYTMSLSSDASLLDMAAAKKWILLANAIDETNLNNKLFLDLGKKVGMQWTPDCQWVDLYLNGEYSGLYLLTEKVDVHENRLSLDSNAGEFLCYVSPVYRWSELDNPFMTAAGRAVDIAYPKNTTASQLSEIESRVNQMEAEILSGADLRESSVIDLDSWVRKYLIDEISANIDADLASSYFYCSDDKIIAGPLWDYDMVLGNSPRNHDPHAFLAKSYRKSRTKTSMYYDTLYRNESFHNRMVEIYLTEFLPELQRLEDTGIDAYIAFIEKASQSNSLRWRSVYDNLYADVVHTPSALKDYFSKRLAFLNSAWLDNTPYCTVQFEPSYNGASYLSVSVEKGGYFKSSYIDTESTVWIDSETGEVFDFSQPIVKDRIFWNEKMVNSTS